MSSTEADKTNVESNENSQNTDIEQLQAQLDKSTTEHKEELEKLQEISADFQVGYLFSRKIPENLKQKFPE